MNEGILISYDDTCYSMGDILGIEKKLTDILKPCGMRYFTGHTIYKPYEQDARDDIMHDARRMLVQSGILKNTRIRILVIDDISRIPLQDIDCSGMSEPGSKKYKYYEDYFKETGVMAHDILIDEDNRIVDGYISLLLANKYNKVMREWQRPSVFKVNTSNPYAKVVIGRHVSISGTNIAVKGPQHFTWIYNIKEPVVPGDILKVDTRKGEAYMVVEKIKYIAGKKNCMEYRKVVGHTGIRMKD